MAVAAEKWMAYECRSEDGLLLATDEFFPLDGSPRVGYRFASPIPLSTLHSSGNGGWIEVDPLCECQDKASGLIAEAGGGPLESEGFVALKRSAGGLIWILHLTNSEVFSSVSFEGGEVVAVAEEYPFRNEFRIPIAEPGLLQFRSERIT